MTARPATTSRSRSDAGRRRPARRSGAITRRRVLAGLGILALLAVAVLALRPQVDHAVKEITLPLRHEDIIRQQARDKGVDAALIAGVIYQESRFHDQTSAAGARGLMQITRDTAAFIASRSKGTRFTFDDLATPEINIRYGTFYLRYLLDRYRGDETLALAAYNGGAGNVDRWRAKAAAAGHELTVGEIPFPETRAYVRAVEQAQRDYRHNYARELGY